jgi:hypothetical protein
MATWVVLHTSQTPLVSSSFNGTGYFLFKGFAGTALNFTCRDAIRTRAHVRCAFSFRSQRNYVTALKIGIIFKILQLVLV